MQMGVKRLIVVSTPQRTRKSARPVVICEDQASIHLKKTEEKRIIKTMRNRNRTLSYQVDCCGTAPVPSGEPGFIMMTDCAVLWIGSDYVLKRG